MKTEQELKQLAIDIVEGKVFGTWNLKRMDEVKMVFMVAIGLDSDQSKKLIEDDVMHFYEYMDKAGPRSINGMPMFFSANYLTGAEFDILLPLIKQYKESKEAFLATAE